MDGTETQSKSDEQTEKPKKKQRKPLDYTRITTEVEKNVGVSLEALTNLYMLDGVKGFGPQAFKSLHTRDIKDLSLAFNKVLGCVSGFTPGGHQAVAVSKVQIVLPPKTGEITHA
jgi:hypothetical protein